MRSTWSVLLLSLVWGACASGSGGVKRASETVKEAPAPSRTSVETLDHLGPAADSSCRGFRVPEALDTRGCRVQGAYPGELSGHVLGPEGDFEETLRRCLAEPRCGGIVSDWYTGMPWSAVAVTSPFEPDPSSYGCVMVVGGCP